ncbi:MAG: glycosyltransferase family 4 protein [Mesorhizobium sp.]
MRRLLFVGGAGDPGGLQIHTADVAQAAAALGHSVAIVSGEVDYFSNIIPTDRISFETVRRFSAKKLRRRPFVYAIIRAFVWLSVLSRYKDHDIILCRGALAETPVLELLIARALGRKIYTIEHAPWPLGWPFLISKPMYGRITNGCVRRVITVSTELADMAKNEYRIAAEKIRICFNWIDPNFRSAGVDRRREARWRLSLPEDAPVIGYLGRHGPEKRVDVLIEAFRQHLARRQAANPVLLIAGDGWFRRDFEKAAEKSGVGGRIRFVGWHSNPRDILDALDLFVLPSLSEGFPLALMEAMASGLPCIAHPMSSTLELIDNNRNGIVSDLSSAELLADALTTLQDVGRERWNEMGLAAAETIARSFSRDIRLKAVLNALDIELGNADVPPPYSRELEFRG